MAGRASLASIAVLLLVVVAGCTDSPTAPSVELDDEFTLAPGESRFVATTGLQVRFVQVDGDSRCPADALCIQGGDALVRITVTGVGADQDYTLHTGTMAPVQHGDFTITLVQLSPYPFSATPIAPEDYRATLRVTRSTAPPTPAARHLGGQRLEPWFPHPAEAPQPRLELVQRRGLHRIEPPGTVGTHRREAAVAQHLQVLRHRRLGDAELALNHLDNAARRHFPRGQHLEDAPPHRIAQHVEGVHRARRQAPV